MEGSIGMAWSIRRGAFTAAALLLMALGVQRPAHANGRFPRAQQLIVDPDDSNRLWLRATYGLLTTSDGAQHWRWVCEGSIGYRGTEDPAIGLTSDGTLLAGIFNGLSRSTDQACNWAFVQNGLEKRYVVDLTVEPKDRSRAVVLVSANKNQGSSTFLNQVWRSTDAGQSFSQLGPDLAENMISFTLDPAPSKPDRIYVSASFADPTDGGSTSQGALLVSDDDGASYQRHDIPNTDVQRKPYIGAVDPTNPDVVYVRVEGPVNKDGFVEHVLYVTRDAGQSFQEAFRAPAAMLGFALSPDGTEVLVGMGDPRDIMAPVDASALGIYRASTADLNFQRIFSGHIGCLLWTANGLYACTSQFQTGFELGFSTDMAQNFTPLLTLTTLDGPLECSADSTTTKECTDQWAATCELIGKCGVVQDAGPEAGAAEPKSEEDSGCGCSVPHHRSSPPWSAVLLLVGVSYARARSWSKRRARAR